MVRCMLDCLHLCGVTGLHMTLEPVGCAAAHEHMALRLCDVHYDCLHMLPCCLKVC